MTDPLARRDWFVEAQARRRMALGAPVPTEAFQRQAAADLTLLDNVRASGHLRVTKDPPRRPIVAKESLKASALAAKQGGRTYVKALPAVDKQAAVGVPIPGLTREKQIAMEARVRLIGQRSAGTLRSGADMHHAFVYSELARAAAEAAFNCDAQRGEYAGKSARDRKRIFYRRIEDICDRSNAVIRPPWWVK